MSEISPENIIEAHRKLALKVFDMCYNCKKKNKCQHHTYDGGNPCAKKWDAIDSLMCACLNGKEK
jgi:hypothetical protein